MQLLVAERGPLVWVFNFSPSEHYKGLKIPMGVPGKYRPVLSSDAREFDGRARVNQAVDHFTSPESPPLEQRCVSLVWKCSVQGGGGGWWY